MANLGVNDKKAWILENNKIKGRCYILLDFYVVLRVKLMEKDVFTTFKNPHSFFSQEFAAILDETEGSTTQFLMESIRQF
jgi:hypothetical protein